MRELVELFRAVRSLTVALIEPLEAEDLLLQAVPETSPPKWHLAHTTWFFEKFVLGEALAGRAPFHPSYDFLFNSYYEAVGARHPRQARGLLSRPPIREVLQYRHATDDAMLELLERGDLERWPWLPERVRLGLEHEQQHQELLLMDLKRSFFANPLRPAYRDPLPGGGSAQRALSWRELGGGLIEVGHGGEGFAFDNESPRHKRWVDPFAIADRPVTAGEFLAFVEDGGYRTPGLWLSDGWDAVQSEGWAHPLYWERLDGGWAEFTLAGRVPLELDAPVCHVSHYEADAYARWAGARLPREEEWELAAQSEKITGNFLESGALHPRPAAGQDTQLFGDVWELTASAYLPYPGFRPAPGAVGEYNGKFMSNQIVLRGGSCLTPQGHVRATYRNFFYPHQRWCCQGFRLAR